MESPNFLHSGRVKNIIDQSGVFPSMSIQDLSSKIIWTLHDPKYPWGPKGVI